MATAKRRGDKWRVRVYLGKDEHGKPQYASITAATKKQAEYEAALLKLKRPHNKSALTVGEAVDRYINAKDAVLSPRTIRGYQAIRQTAMPDLMQMAVDTLSAETAQIAVNRYSRDHSPKTVRNVVALVSSALAMCAPGVKLTVTLPQRIKTDIDIPDDKAVKRLLDEAEGTEMYTVILLATALGLRRSEICALTWDDFDAKGAKLRINKALVIGPDDEWVIKTTKTTSSTRTMIVPPFLVDHLQGLDQDGERIISIIHPAALTLRFIKIRDRLGLRMRFHDLRHYYASMMLALGVPDKYAMQRMGHTTTHMLKTVYQHLTDDKQREVDEAINSRLAEVFNGSPAG